MTRPLLHLLRPDSAMREIPVRERSDAECAALAARTFAESRTMAGQQRHSADVNTRDRGTHIVAKKLIA